MLWIAVLGLAVNLAGMRLLAARQGDDLNLKGAYLEVWSDMLGSVGVIVGALVIRVTGWTWIDSAVAVAIGLWVMPRAWQLMRASLNVLLEGVPEGVVLAEVDRALCAQPGVRSVHDLHVWAISTGHVSLSAHVLVDAGREPDTLLHDLRALLRQRFGIAHSTLQLETRPCEQAGAHGSMH